MGYRHDATSLEGLKKSCDVDPIAGCWLWRGALSHGYGNVRNPTTHRAIRVHCLSFTFAGGVVPTGYVLDHLCRTRRCCNPDHLRVVTARENVLAPGSLSVAAVRLSQTHCIYGHPLSGTNLYIRSNGCRMCRACMATRRRVKRAERRESHGQRSNARKEA